MAAVAARQHGRPVMPEKPRLRARVFLPFALAFLVLAGVAIYGALKPTKAVLGNPYGPPTGLVWGNGLFHNRAELRAWLRNHGVSYKTWAKTHPAARALVSPTARRRRAHVPAAAKKLHPVAAPKVAAAPTQVVTTTTARSRDKNMLTWAAIAIGLLFGLIAIVPARTARRFGLTWLAEEREFRLGVAGAGAALLVGVAIATL
jgi:hypothetical protein